MSAPRQLTIEAADAIVLVPRWAFLEAGEQRALQPARAPYGLTWFPVGDGQWMPAPLALDVFVTGTTVEESITRWTELLRVSEAAILVRWGEYRRPVAGLVGYTRQPLIMGYRARLDFAPTGPTWLDDHDQAVRL